MTTTQSANDDTPGTADRPGSARDRVSEAAASARTATADAFATAREKVGTVLHDASERAGTAYDDARDRVGRAVDSTRDAAGSAGRRAIDGARDNPIAALVGGLTLGAIAAALLPRTEREIAAFGALGTRLNDAARDAAGAAKDAGRDKLDELGLTRDRAQETVSKLFADVAKAATHAGGAAIGSVRKTG